MKNKNRETLLICLLIPAAAGSIAGWFTRDGMEVFAQLKKPPLSPPGWLFPVVWTILYLLMGLACFRITQVSGKQREKERALYYYGLQLAANVLWPVWFFQFHWYLFAFLWLLLLWILAAAAAWRFYHLDKTAGLWMVPYLLWILYAGYLNGGIFLLNP